MANKPVILIPGNDPDCVHEEYIDNQMLGHCQKCHQVRAYPGASRSAREAMTLKASRADTVPMMTEPPAVRMKTRKRHKRVSILGNSGMKNYYASPASPKPTKPEPVPVYFPTGGNKQAKKVLIRGRDF